jgi:uncharacterized protein
MSEQTERNIEVIKKGYEAFAAGDVETVLSLFDDDIEWVQPGQSAISGTYHGKGELGQFFARLAEKGAGGAGHGEATRTGQGIGYWPLVPTRSLSRGRSRALS